MPFARVTFAATDGQRVAAWWIPARADASRATATPTVLLCHGFIADKAQDLNLARDLVPGGFNVLAIDLRGHGESGGQVVGFGHAERCDVLGEVRWLRETRPDACRRVFGVGRSWVRPRCWRRRRIPPRRGRRSTGSPCSAPITIRSRSSTRRQPGCSCRRWTVSSSAPPCLSLAPPRRKYGQWFAASGRSALWPHPFFIHGQGDKYVPFDAGRNLYDHALQPKYFYWVPHTIRSR